MKIQERRVRFQDWGQPDLFGATDGDGVCLKLVIVVFILGSLI